MTNYEKIKSMNIQEMEDFICSQQHECNQCDYHTGLSCGLRQWLELESEIKDNG